MPLIAFWVSIYSIVVAASILFLGSPSTILGNLNLGSLLKLLIDWRFLLGAALALMARFIFIIINNLASKHPVLEQAHLSITALATIISIIVVLVANNIILHEQLSTTQIIGAAIILFGVFLVFR